MIRFSKEGYALISNRAFVDGNKRIGIYVMLSFLEMNGIRIHCTNDDLARIGLAVADGSMKYEDLVQWVIAHRLQEPFGNSQPPSPVR